MPKTPVFIVGSPRSGTSVLVTGLSRVGYQGYREGNFLPLMMIIEKAVDRFLSEPGKKNPNVLAAHVDPTLLKSRIEGIFKELMDGLNAAPLWFDKSGNHEMIRAIPVLRRLWPQSVFIFAKRRAIENVVSRMKKFPRRNFEYHCADWARNMSAWREIRPQLPPDTYLEVDQHDLIQNTAAICARISGLLELAPGQDRTLAKTFKSARPQQTTKGSALETYRLESLGWSEAQLAVFRKHCVPEMQAYGYGLGSEYNLPG